MRKKLLSCVLALIMLVSLINPQFVFADNTEKNVSLITPSTKTSALEAFLRQAGNKYSDDSEVNIIVQVNDKTMETKYGLSVPDIKDLKKDGGIEKQVLYSEKSQEKLISAMDNVSVDYVVNNRYETVLNAVVISTSFEQAKVIAGLEEVEFVELVSVIKAPELKEHKIFTPKDASSNKMIKVAPAWAKDYSGKGSLVAVIDSGADPEHQVFSEVVKGDNILDREKVEKLIKEKGINPGKYFNSKIPFGYNYADKNQIIKEKGDRSHGMHVAGIIAANYQGKDGLMGVAPDSQLAIMRVFGGGASGSTTNSDIYNKAIDDSVKLGADTINMSLGSSSGSDSRLPESTMTALKNAKKAGIVVAIAAGNDGFMGYGLLPGPSPNNPNYGMIGSPAVADIAMSVASVDNAEIRQKAILVRTSDGTDVDRKISYTVGGDIKVPEGYKEYEFCGLGKPSDFDIVGSNKKKDLTGKYALIQRGEITFTEKILEAQKHGAIGVVVFDNVDAGLTTMQIDKDKIKIPSFFISKANGEFLKNNAGFKISFSKEDLLIANPTAYDLSKFSSWGFTEEGNLKPDISAPGGSIYSSINHGKYAIMSGTSMATPHVAGGIAIVKEYVEKTFPNIEGDEKHILIKNILMSTATPHRFSDGSYGSPRGQGAGLMTLDRAVVADVVALGTNGVSSINLGDIRLNKFSVKGSLKNYGNEERVYEYYGILNTDKVEKGHITLTPKNLRDTKDNKKQITVPAKGKVDFEISFELTDSEVKELKAEMPNGFYLEGYIFFESPGGEKNINIPFVGFKGVWDDLLVIEPSIYDLLEQGKKPLYYDYSNRFNNPFTYLATLYNRKVEVLGQTAKDKYDKTKIAFSPNGDNQGEIVGFIGTFLRNFKDFELGVFKEEDKEFKYPVYKVTGGRNYGYKNFYDSGIRGPNLNQVKDSWIWDGKKSNGESLPEGKYIFQVKAKPDGKSDEFQVLDFPLIIDTTFPKITKSSYDKDKNTFKLEEVKENGSGIKSILVVYNISSPGMIPSYKDIPVEQDGKSYILPKGKTLKDVFISITDYAFNRTFITLEKALITGTEKVIVIEPTIEGGVITDDMFDFEVQDKDSKVVENKDLPSGEYFVVISNIHKDYELVGDSKIPVTIKDTDTEVKVKIEFKRKGKYKATVELENKDNATVRLFLVNKEDEKKEFELAADQDSDGKFVTYVSSGTYKIEARSFDKDLFYLFTPDGDIIELNDKTPEASKYFKIMKKEFRKYSIELKRNNYEGALDVVLVGDDYDKSQTTVHFDKNESSKTVELPHNLNLEVFTKNYEKDGFGSKTTKHLFNGINQVLTIEITEGIKNPDIVVDKEELKAYIEKAEMKKESEYLPEVWEYFEKVLYRAQKIFFNKLSSQEEVNAVIIELKSALNDLEQSKDNRSVLKKDLEKRIKEAEEIYSEIEFDPSYTKESKDALRDAIFKAKDVLKSNNSLINNDATINKEIKSIDDAVSGLKMTDGSPNLIPLKLLLEEVNSILENKDSYQPEDVVNALAEAKKQADDFINEKSQNETILNGIYANLKEKLSKIESKADKTELKKEVDQDINVLKYTMESREPYKKALELAVEVLKKKYVTQKEVDDALAELKAKREALVKIEGSDGTVPKPPTPPTPPTPTPIPTPPNPPSPSPSDSDSTVIVDKKPPLDKSKDIEKPKDKEDKKQVKPMEFKDLSKDYWAYDSIKTVFEKGIITGVTKDEFKPEAKVTRAMMATILYRLSGEEAKDLKSEFTDLKKDGWYETAVNWCADKGIVKGYSKEKFGPEDNVTREQMVQMMYSYAKYKKIELEAPELTGYTDQDKVADYAKDAMKWSISKGIIKGVSEGKLAPQELSNRAQVSTVIERFLKILK